MSVAGLRVGARKMGMHRANMPTIRVALMADWISRAGFLVFDEWLTGVRAEDLLVMSGKCPYQTGYGGWQDPYALCSQDRSPDEGDWPYCKPHAAQIRDDRGYGGYVG
jgi:hypothetical protein